MTDLTFKNIACSLEVKQVKDEDFVHIEGLASTFGNLDRDGDIIAKGAFTNTLTKRKPKLIYQHRMDQPLGVIDMIYEAEEGLRIKARMPKDNSMVKDLYSLLKMGALGDFSIGFNIVESDTNADGTRVIKEVDLWEVSIVTIPANPEARIMGVKRAKDGEKEQKDSDDKTVDVTKAETITSKREFERMLRDTGVFTRKASEILTKRFIEDDQGELGESKQDEQGEPVSNNEVKSLIEAMNELKKSLT